MVSRTDLRRFCIPPGIEAREMKAVMDVLRIEGGRRLSGVVDVPGSKNAALAIWSPVR